MAHWCKSAINEVLPVQSVESLSTALTPAHYPLPPPPVPPRLRATTALPSNMLFYPACSPRVEAMTTFQFPSAPNADGIIPMMQNYRILDSPRHQEQISTVPSKTQDQPPSSHAALAWPPALNAFVIRAFTNCKSAADRELMTAQLEKLISRISANGKLEVYMWENEPTPDIRASPDDGHSVMKRLVAPSDLTCRASLDTRRHIEEPTVLVKKRKSRFENSSICSELSQSRSDSLPLIAKVDQVEENKRKKRKQSKYGFAQDDSTSYDFGCKQQAVVGTCQKLDKEYFRLTSPPDASTVRPEGILKLALQGLKRKWRDHAIDYVALCSQLKAIRQDLTVQHIQSEFTAEVYETHARIALECSDLNEYNQCQTQLIHLYAKGIGGSEAEFVAYRILYYVYLLGNKKYQSGSSDLAFAMVTICSRAIIMSNPAVQHALEVRRAVQQENYHAFFKLCKLVPNLGICILKPMLDNIRLLALHKICKGFKPVIELSFVSSELGFEGNDEATNFLVKVGCIIVDSEDTRCINTTDTVIDATGVHTQDKLLL